MAKEKVEAIMLSKYLVGSFGEIDESNIPHEIINEFRDDEGNQYIYIPPYGGYDVDTYAIKYVLFTGKTSFKPNQRDNHDDYQCFEILNLVEVDHLLNGVVSNKSNIEKQEAMKRDKEVSSIKYGGKPLTEIRMASGNDSFEKEAYYATFKAKAIYKLKDGIKMHAGYGFQYSKNDIVMDKKTIIQENGTRKNYEFWRQRGYIPKTFDDGSINSNYKNFISKILTNEKINNDFWEEIRKPILEKSEIIQSRKDSMNFMRIIQREYDETAYSNLMYNFFYKNKKLLNAFVKEVLQMADDEYEIHKEVSVSIPENDFQTGSSIELERTGFVDLLIVGGKNIAVIENKIKSGLNGLDKKNKRSQLSLYYWVFYQNKGNCEDINRLDNSGRLKTCKCFILKPNYAEIDWDRDPGMKENYTEINYKVLYDFLEGKKDLCESDFQKYFDDFRNSLFIHTLSKEEDIKSRFLMAIADPKDTK